MAARRRKTSRKPRNRLKSAKRKPSLVKRTKELSKKFKRKKASHKGSRPAKAESSKARQSRPSRKNMGLMMVDPLDQVFVTCSNCGRKFEIVKPPELSSEGLICQRCTFGEIQFPD